MNTINSNEIKSTGQNVFPNKNDKTIEDSIKCQKSQICHCQTSNSSVLPSTIIYIYIKYLKS